ncbi:hypothetical protein JNM05_13815 [bacterium]|nr:hypothetical protein [bacterium]
MKHFVISSCLLVVFALMGCSTKSDQVTLKHAWKSTDYPIGDLSKYIVIDGDSSGTYFTPTLDDNCYSDVTLTITDGIMLIGHAHFTYELTATHLYLTPASYLDTVIGYSLPGTFILTDNVSLTSCD